MARKETHIAQFMHYKATKDAAAAPPPTATDTKEKPEDKRRLASLILCLGLGKEATATTDLVRGQTANTTGRVATDQAVNTSALRSRAEVSLHSLTEASAALAWRYDAQFERFVRDLNAVPCFVDFEMVDYVNDQCFTLSCEPSAVSLPMAMTTGTTGGGLDGVGYFLAYPLLSKISMEVCVCVHARVCVCLCARARALARVCAEERLRLWQLV